MNQFECPRDKETARVIRGSLSQPTSTTSTERSSQMRTAC
jgi:hypothetical protein